VQSTGQSGSGSPRSRDEEPQIIEMLIAAGARPTDRDAHGQQVREVAMDRVRPMLSRRRAAKPHK